MKTKTNKLNNNTNSELKSAVKLSRWLGGVLVLPMFIIEKLLWNQLKKSELNKMVKDMPLIAPTLLWLFIFVLMLSIGGRIYLWLR